VIAKGKIFKKSWRPVREISSDATGARGKIRYRPALSRERSGVESQGDLFLSDPFHSVMLLPLNQFRRPCRVMTGCRVTVSRCHRCLARHARDTVRRQGVHEVRQSTRYTLYTTVYSSVVGRVGGVDLSSTLDSISISAPSSAGGRLKRPNVVTADELFFSSLFSFLRSPFAREN
jgi:hypothetical protein